MADIDPAGRDKKLASTSNSRRSSRDSLFLSATVRRNGESGEALVPVRVRNLSTVGVMVDYIEVATPGEQVEVTVRGLGTVPGKVAWVKQGRIGISFDLEVDPKMARKPVKPAPQPLRSVPRKTRPRTPLFRPGKD